MVKETIIKRCKRCQDRRTCMPLVPPSGRLSELTSTSSGTSQVLTNHGKSLTRPLTNHRVCLRTCPKRLYSQQNLSIYTALKWLHVELWATIKYMISLLTWRYTLHMAISSFRQHTTLTLPNT